MRFFSHYRCATSGSFLEVEVRLPLYFRTLFKPPQNHLRKPQWEPPPSTYETCESACFPQKFFLKPSWAVVLSLNSWSLNSWSLNSCTHEPCHPDVERLNVLLRKRDILFSFYHTLSIYIKILRCIEKKLFLNMLLSVLCISHNKGIDGLAEHWSTIYNNLEHCLIDANGEVLGPLLLKIKLSNYTIFFFTDIFKDLTEKLIKNSCVSQCAFLIRVKEELSFFIGSFDFSCCVCPSDRCKKHVRNCKREWMIPEVIF